MLDHKTYLRKHLGKISVNSQVTKLKINVQKLIH